MPKDLVKNNKSNENNDKNVTIDPSINLADLLEEHPELTDVLADEFGIYCAMCPLYGFDTLKEAAEFHGIEGEDFEEMMKILEKQINTMKKSK